MLPFGKRLPCLSLAFACRRGISSKSQSLHDRKMEALVSLYHQSNTFVTPENLSAVIDQAFTQPMNVADDQRKHTLAELVKMRRRRRDSPRFFLSRDDGHSHSESMGPGWTESKSRRVDQVYRALMGIQKDGRPSWVALKENSRRLECQGDREVEARRRSVSA